MSARPVQALIPSLLVKMINEHRAREEQVQNN